jgi:hypothetical protein
MIEPQAKLPPFRLTFFDSKWRAFCNLQGLEIKSWVFQVRRFTA